MANPQTLLQILNRVLPSLRENQIASGTTQLTAAYHLTLLEFFNQVREEVEDACNWRALRQDYTLTFNAGVNAVVITGSNERSRLVRCPIVGQGNMADSGFYGPPVSGSDTIAPLVFDVTSPSTTGVFGLQEMPLDALQYMDSTTNAQATSQPSAFALSTANTEDTDAGNGEQWLYIFPRPNNTRTIKITMVTPELIYAATDTGRNIYVPTLPIIHGLQWMAREERGEELGPQGIYTEERYRRALDNAVSRELAEQGDPLDCVLL